MRRIAYRRFKSGGQEFDAVPHVAVRLSHTRRPLADSLLASPSRQDQILAVLRIRGPLAHALLYAFDASKNACG